MTTGYKINRAKDDAAGYSIASQMEAKLSSYDVASNNAQIGLDMLTTTEENYTLINDHLLRIRDLAEQAANGTYSEDSRTAIEAEIASRLAEIALPINTSSLDNVCISLTVIKPSVVF